MAIEIGESEASAAAQDIHGHRVGALSAVLHHKACSERGCGRTGALVRVRRGELRDALRRVEEHAAGLPCRLAGDVDAARYGRRPGGGIALIDGELRWVVETGDVGTGIGDGEQTGRGRESGDGARTHWVEHGSDFPEREWGGTGQRRSTLRHGRESTAFRRFRQPSFVPRSMRCGEIAASFASHRL